jgi:hypothetical protein
MVYKIGQQLFLYDLFNFHIDFHTHIETYDNCVYTGRFHANGTLPPLETYKNCGTQALFCGRHDCMTDGSIASSRLCR